MGRKACITALCGVLGTGKTYFQTQTLAKFNERNLVVPSSPDDTAWHGYDAIDIDAILKRVLGMERHDVIELDDKKNRDKKMQLCMYMSKVFWKIRGTVVFPLWPEEDVLFDCITQSQYGFKLGGLFVDDTKNWFPSSTPDKTVGATIRGLRHREVDCFFSVHGLMDLHKMFFKYQPKIWVFNTEESFMEQVPRKVWSKAQAEKQEAVRLRIREIAKYADPHNPKDLRNYAKELLILD